MRRMAKEKEKRIQPYASSPCFKKDFTFNEDKKQKRIPKRSNTSKTVDKKPEGECVAILLGESAKASREKKTTAPKNKSPALKKTLGSFFLIVFKKFADFLKDFIEPALKFQTALLLTRIP